MIWRRPISGTRRDVSCYQFRLGDKSTQKAVQTKHQDKKSGKLRVVDLGNEDSPDGLPPVHTDRHIYPNKSAAEQAVKARLAAFNCSTAGVRLEMPGRTDLFAERMINAQGFKCCRSSPTPVLKPDDQGLIALAAYQSCLRQALR